MFSVSALKTDSVNLDGALGDSVVVKNPFKVPYPPADPFAKYITKEFVILAWNEPANNGGSKITGYQIEFKSRNSLLWSKANKITCVDREFRVTGLDQGISYSFRVYAQNQAGMSRASKPLEGICCRDPVDPPTEVEVINVTKSSVTIRWKKPAYDGGSKITGYNIEKSDSTTGRFTRVNFGNVSDCYYKLDGLKEGDNVVLRVIAKNAINTVSRPSEPTSEVTVKDMLESPDIEYGECYRDIQIIKSGDPLIIKAEAMGKPPPRIQWRKDNVDIYSSIKWTHCEQRVYI